MKKLAFMLALILLLQPAALAAPGAKDTGRDDDFVFSCGTSMETQESYQAALLRRWGEAGDTNAEAEMFGFFPENLDVFPTTGEARILVLPIEFADSTARDPEEEHAFLEQCYFGADDGGRMLDQSLQAQFLRHSYGRLTVTGTVLPIYSAGGVQMDYARSIWDFYSLVAQALATYDIDYSQYDGDGDTYVDAIVVRFGDGVLDPADNKVFTSSGWATWLTHITLPDDTMKIRNLAAIDTRERFAGGSVHELGHCMGLPDNYEPVASCVIEAIHDEVMAGNSQRFINSFYKYLLGWIDPIILTEESPMREVDLHAIERYQNDNEVKAVLYTQTPEKLPFTEFYIGEYRNGVGGDSMDGIIDPGITLWHCEATLDAREGWFINNHTYIQSVKPTGNTAFSRADLFVPPGSPWNVYSTNSVIAPDTAPVNSGFYNDVTSKFRMEVVGQNTDYTTIRVGAVGAVPGAQEPLKVSPVADKVYGDAPFQLSAIGGSGTGAVNWTVTAGDAVEVTDDGIATIVKSGTATVTVTKDGDTDFDPATTTIDMTISKAELTLTADSFRMIHGEAMPSLTYNISGFVKGEDESVLSGTPDLSTTYTPGADAGSYPLTITAGTLAADNYSFSFVNGTLSVGLSEQEALTVDTPQAKTYGDEPFRLTTTGGSGTGAVTFHIQSGSDVLNIDGNTATILQAGIAEIYATKAGDTNYAAATSAPITVTIGQRDIQKASIAALSTATYDGTAHTPTPDVTDGEIPISVDDYDVAYTHNTDAGIATLTLTGKGNYTGTKSAAFTIDKAEPSYSVPTGLTATYGDTLDSVALPGGFTWEESLTTSVGSAGTRSHSVKFTPSDTVNYNTVSGIPVDVTVGKADPSYTAPTDLAATYGQTLSDVALPGGFNWEESLVTSVGGAGTQTHHVTFTPGDTENYHVVTHIGIDVTVNKAVLTLTADNKDVAFNDAVPILTHTASGFADGEDESVLSGAPELTTTYVPGAVTGSYPITMTAGTLASDNYSFTFVDGTLSVGLSEQAELTVDPPQAKAYGDAPFQFTTSGGSGTGAVTYTRTTGDAVAVTPEGLVTILKAGTVQITAAKAADSNYAAAVSAPITVTIGQRDIQNAAIADLSPVTYTGAAHTPMPAVTDSGGAITAGDYDVSYAHNTDAGTATLTLSGKGNYTGTKSATFTIKKAEPSYTVPTGLTAIYGQALSDVVLPVGFTWEEPTTTAVGNAGTQTHTTTYTPANTANYNVVSGIDAGIAVGKATLTITAENKNIPFGAATPAFTYTANGFIDGEDKGVLTGEPSITTTYTPGADAGSYPIAIDMGTLASDNYSFTFVDGTLSVGLSEQAELNIDPPQTKAYGDAPFQLTTSGGSGTGAVTYTRTSGDAVTVTPEGVVTILKAGTVQITAAKAADSNYAAAASAPITVTIGRRDIQNAAIADLSPVTYTGAAHTPTPAVTDSGGAITAGDYDVSYAHNTDAGTATLTLSGKGNYTGTKSATFTIKKAEPSYTVPTGLTATYGQALADVVLPVGFTWEEPTTTAVGNAGTQTHTTTYTPADTENYNVVTNIGIGVTVNKVVLTLTADNKNVLFDDAVPTLTYTISGLVDGEDESVLSGTPELTTTYVPGAATGSYPIAIDMGTLASDNYSFTFVDGTLSVGLSEQAELNIDPPQTKAYGDAPFQLTTSGGSGTGAVTYTRTSGDAVAVTREGLVTVVKAGKAEITAGKAADDNFAAVTSAPITIAVNKAGLTITARSYTITQGDALPEFGYDTTDLQADDKLLTAPELTCTVKDSASAGTFPITPRAADAGDCYTVTYVPGTLTIKTSGSGGNGGGSGGGGGFIPPIVTEPTQQSAPAFQDIAGHWAEENIKAVVEKGLFKGVSDSAFDPGGVMTRAMLFTVLARLDGQDLSGGVAWYSAALNWAVTEGISDGTNPEGNITREQLAVMLWRYAVSHEIDGGRPDEGIGPYDGFDDAGSVSPWAADAMRWAVDRGIVKGSGNKLTPNGIASRAEVAAMLVRFIGEYET